MADRKSSRLILKIVAPLAVVAAVALLLAWVLVWRGGETTGGGSFTVECGTDAPSTFVVGGEEHRVRLLEAVGSSARVVFSSDSPNEVSLTAGIPSRVDLDSDAMPDASVTLLEVSPSRARIRVTPDDYLAWDESGFEVQGGLKNSYDVGVNRHDFSVVPVEGGYLLLYLPYNKRLIWERHHGDGALVTEPGLQVGTVDPGVSDGKVYEVDGVSLGDGVALAVRTRAGVSVRAYDRHLYRGGQPLRIGKNMQNPALVKGGEDLFVVTQGVTDPPSENPRGGIVVTRASLGASPAILRQRTVRELRREEGEIELRFHDAAWDEETGCLAVLFTRRAYPSAEQRSTIIHDLQLMLVDPQTLEPVRTVSITAGSTSLTHGCLAVREGTATVVWARGQSEFLVSEVDTSSGEVTQAWSGRRGTGSPRYFGVNYHCQLLESAGEGSPLLFAYWHGSNVRALIQGEGFLLRAWEGDGWAGSDIPLEWGRPALPDPLLDLNAFQQVPCPAVCGGPVSLRGRVINRGCQRTNGVSVRASVGGEEIGSANLGNIEPACSADFSMTWVVPADYLAEQVEVTFTLTTSSRQYTTGNDSAPHTFSVRQKGLVFGRVVDASSDVRHRLGWYASMPNVRVTVGDRQVLTDKNGDFIVDGLEFGTYQVRVEHEGYNPLQTQVTVTRTKPMAFVNAEMDNHGVITIQVVDDHGNPLEGVQVSLHEYRETERTPAGGKLSWDISAGTYTFSFTKRGYHPVSGQQVEVVLGEERTQTVVMREIATGFLGGMVVKRRGQPVGGASVTIMDEKGNVVRQIQVDEGGIFQPVELEARPSKVYRVAVSGEGMTSEESILLYGGDKLFRFFKLVPDLGEKRIRSATEGYTSWMVKAGWPGFMDVSGADMYAWFGNYAICVSAEYWSGTKDLAAVGVTVWGGTYETHATKSEIDISGWFQSDAGSIFDITEWADIPGKLVEDHPSDLLDIADALISGFNSEDDEYIVTDQGSELLTWKEAREDFAPKLEFDSSDPLHSMWDVVTAVPHSFAIPLVIGGSSPQQTAVRVDQVDVLHLLTNRTVGLSGPTYEWFSFDGPTGTENYNGKRYEITEEEIPYDEVVVYVWLTVQKYWGGEPSGTCFTQREKQVVVFKPGTQSMKAYIAPGDLYRNLYLLNH